MFAFAAEAPLDGIARITREIAVLEAERIALARAYQRSNAWTAKYGSAAAAIASECTMTEGAVRALLSLGETLEVLPQTAEAFAAGDISRQSANTIAKAATSDRADALAEQEGALVEAAQTASPRELQDAVKTVTDQIDGDLGLSDDERMYHKRAFELSKNTDGMLVPSGALEPESGEIVATALDAEMERDFAKADPRSIAQRRADALTNICRSFLQDGHAGESHGIRPHLTVVCDLQALDASDELRAAARIQGQVTGRLSAAMLERIACDCDITHAIIDGDGCVLNMGRAVRVPTAAQWKALVVRDKCCRGCGRHVRYCQAHHIKYWTKNGPTDLDNLILLCWHCHRKQHADDTQAERVRRQGTAPGFDEFERRRRARMPD